MGQQKYMKNAIVINQTSSEELIYDLNNHAPFLLEITYLYNTYNCVIIEKKINKSYIVNLFCNAGNGSFLHYSLDCKFFMKTHTVCL
jgi:hypothetical protein